MATVQISIEREFSTHVDFITVTIEVMPGSSAPFEAFARFQEPDEPDTVEVVDGFVELENGSTRPAHLWELNWAQEQIDDRPELAADQIELALSEARFS